MEYENLNLFVLVVLYLQDRRVPPKTLLARIYFVCTLTGENQIGMLEVQLAEIEPIIPVSKNGTVVEGYDHD